MQHELVVHFPIYDFPEWQERALEAFHIIGCKEHGVRTAEDPLVWRLVGLCRGEIREWTVWRARRNAFSETYIIPGTTGHICKKIIQTFDEIGAEPDIGFESDDESFLLRCLFDGFRKVHAETDFSAREPRPFEREGGHGALQIGIVGCEYFIYSQICAPGWSTDLNTFFWDSHGFQMRYEAIVPVLFFFWVTENIDCFYSIGPHSFRVWLANRLNQEV